MSYPDTLIDLERNLEELKGPSPVDLSMNDVVEDIKKALSQDDFMTDRYPDFRATSQITLDDQIESAQPKVDGLQDEGEVYRSRLRDFETSLNNMKHDPLVDRIANQYRSAGKTVTLYLIQDVLFELYTTWDFHRSRFSFRRRLKRLKEDNSPAVVERIQRDERRKLAIASSLSQYDIGDTPSIGKMINDIKLTLPGILGIATFAYGTFYLSALFASALFGREWAVLTHVLTVLVALLVHPAASRLPLPVGTSPRDDNKVRIWSGLVLATVVFLHLFFVVSKLPHHVDLLSFVRVSDVGFLIAAGLFAPLYMWRKKALASFSLRTLLNTLEEHDPRVDLFLRDRFNLFVLGLTSFALALVASLAGASAILRETTYVCQSAQGEISLFHISGGRILAGVREGKKAYMVSLSNGVVRRWGDQSECSTIFCAASSRASSCAPATEEVGADTYAGLVDCRDRAKSNIHFFFCPDVHDQYVLAVQCGNARCDVLDGTTPLKVETKGLRAVAVGLASLTGSASYNLGLADSRSDFIASNLPSELDSTATSYTFGENHPFGTRQLGDRVELGRSVIDLSVLKSGEEKCGELTIDQGLTPQTRLRHFLNQRVDVFFCATPAEGKR